MLLIVAIATCVLAIPPPTPFEFVYPKNGDNFTIDTKQNITWDPTHLPALAAVQVGFEFGSSEIQDILDQTDFDQITKECFPITADMGNSVPIDMTIPVGSIQDIIDDLNLPINIDVRWVVNNVLAQIDNIPAADRNVTISLSECNATSPTFQSWIVVSSAKHVFIGLAAVLASLLLVL